MLRPTSISQRFVKKLKQGHGHSPLGFNKTQFNKMMKNPRGRKPWRFNTETANADVTISVIGDATSTSKLVQNQNQEMLRRNFHEQEENEDGDHHEYDDEISSPFERNFANTTSKNQSVSGPTNHEEYGDDDDGNDGFSLMDPNNFCQQQQQQLSKSPMSKAEERKALIELNSGKRRTNPFATLSGFSNNSNSNHRDNSSIYPTSSSSDIINSGDNNNNELSTDFSQYNVKIGKDTALAVHTDPRTINTETDMPFKSITHGAFGASTRKTQIVLPKHINDLYSKITRWSKDLKSSPPTTTATMSDEENDAEIALDSRTGSLDNPSPEAVKANPLLAQHAMQRAKEKLQYGALMDVFERDRFAKEHNLAVAGTKFETQFMNWQGAKVLENVPQQQMEDTRQSKGSLIMHSPRGFTIPKINHDHCPGCGACLQDQKEDEFGYCYPGDIEQYILTYQSVFGSRQQYATRMYELMSHWEKHGKRVGEEWLDFMTQDEFNAIYRFVSRPFICRRCVSLQNYGVTTSTMVMSAPDFKEKLTALREKKCVVVLVVDLTDFPGSMVPDLAGLISMNNPVIIAANKLDCINACSFDYRGRNLEKTLVRVGAGYLKQWVTEQAIQFRLPAHQIKAVVPVSSRKGWGINELVHQIEKWSNITLAKPTPPLSTYFVGVSNVGKSSLINAISHHLHVPEPPHPTSKKVYFSFVDEKTGAEKISWRWHTDKKLYSAEMDEVKSRWSKDYTKLLTTSPLPGTTINAVAIKLSLNGNSSKKNEKDSKYYGGKNNTFLFDTPGLHPVWQETSPLTIKDQVRSLIGNRPGGDGRVLEQGFTLFFGGIGCIDVVKSPTQLFFLTYHSKNVGISHCETERSDAYWRENVGKRLTPPGSRSNLIDTSSSSSTSFVESDNTNLNTSLCVKKSYLFECYENHYKRPKADIYFCGVGWVSFFAREPGDVVLRVRTLPGVVHGVRQPIRKRDMTRFGGWPRMPRHLVSYTKARNNRIEDVIELVNGPKEIDLSRPPLIEVPKTAPITAASGVGRTSKSSSSNVVSEEPKSSDKKKNEITNFEKVIDRESNSSPFDFIMQELQKQGKV